ncbi:MAG: HAD-IA family hydrolase [archaeon]
MIKCILFDMGGVILSGNIEFILGELAKEFKVPVSDLLQFRKEHKEELWDGKLSVKDIAKFIKEKYSLSESVEEILSLWKKTHLAVNHPNQEAVLLVKQLKDHHKVGLISNLWDFHVQINQERNLFKDFEPCLLSCKLGMHKPQKEIFELAITRANVKGEECVFIDDESKHFSVAQSVGMKTIEFKNVPDLILDLKKLGVVVE